MQVTSRDATGTTTDKFNCSVCPVRDHAVCSRCNPEEFEQFKAIRRIRSFSKGAHIMRAGEPMTSVGSLTRGSAYLRRSLEDGRRQMVGLLMPGDFIGRPGRREVAFDIIAGTEVQLCQFRIGDFERILQASPAVSRRLLEMTLDELDAARLWMLVLGRATSRERLTSLFALLVQHDARHMSRKIGISAKIELPFARSDIAEFLGLTIETVSRRFSDLQGDGLIRIEGRRKILIPDYLALIAETGDSESWRHEFHGEVCLSSAVE
ncbi:MAG: Crp/Fnr family transcriptional regulator [Rhodobacteraceae bacterium]|nr:Crp/Fnr family transcriptional regulator [Paracoccaceae bacterium]